MVERVVLFTYKLNHSWKQGEINIKRDKIKSKIEKDVILSTTIF